MSKETVVAVLGLGIMGAGMAHQLLRAGFPVRLFNRNQERYRPFRGSGALLCSLPAEAASGADIVIGMVTDDDASRALWLGDTGALSSARVGAILIECSTLSLNWIDELKKLSAGQGCRFIDAPVTGSKDQAENGKLKFLVGGDPDAIERAGPVFGAMGVEVVRLGAVGSGMALKLVNNFLCAVQVASLAEGLVMLERFDLDQSAALSMLLKGAAGSPLIQTVAARVASGKFAPNVAISVIAKDLGYAIHEGARLGVGLSMGSAALKRFLEAGSAGYGGRDIAALVQVLRQSPTLHN